MICRWLNFINNKKVVLASASPARKEILSSLGIKFQIIPSDFPEDLTKTSPKDYVRDTSENKYFYFLQKNKDLEMSPINFQLKK